MIGKTVDSGSLKVKARSAFTYAVTGKIGRRNIPVFPFILLGIVALVLGVYVLTSSVKPAQGNNLYGICRVYIEKHLQFPDTLRMIQFEQKIPDGENPRSPTKINYELTFSSTDGFGQTSLNTLTCGFKFDQALSKTPQQGIVLERTLMNGREDHGWSDVYYPADKKVPRASDDRSEDLEIFNRAIPAILAYPPDLTLPRHDLKYMKIEDLQNL